uniref:SUEL-type lectin domain-containing protein n=1 Tax=Macrostomum lignano TaxID=282301 RepID=A0A1I8FSQ9_9PLAT
CPKGYKIDILSGFYGRTNKTVCRDEVDALLSSIGNPRVKKACQGRRSCRVSSSNSVFGDPCVGTYKYLKISYRCKTYKPTRNPSPCNSTPGRCGKAVCKRGQRCVIRTVKRRVGSVFRNASPKLSCEHGSSSLSCTSGSTIDVLSAFYGRTSGSVCKRGPIKTTKCRSGSANSAVRRICQGKSSCSVRASNSVFGDPCVGTFKYMRINYRCKSTTPTAAERRKRQKRIQKHRSYLAKLGSRYRRTRAYLQRKLKRATGLKARCVRRR